MPLRYADQKLHTSLCNKTELACVTRHVLNSDAQTSLGWDKLSEVFPSRRVAKQEASRLLKMGSAAMYLPETTSKGGCSISEASSLLIPHPAAEVLALQILMAPALRARARVNQTTLSGC